MNVFLSLLCLVIGYLLGNLSTGMLVSAKAGTDIRHEGSGNPGTTNVMRVLGTKAGTVTFIGDFLKAVLAVLIGRWIGGENVCLCSLASSLGVVLGHNWPFLFGFRGGKGVACSTAIVLLMFPGWGAVAVLCCLMVIFLTRYVSVGSMLMLFCHALLLLFSAQPWYVVLWGILLAVLCFVRHGENIGRLQRGEENRLKFGK